MASAKEPGELWGARALDWARCGEPAWRDVFTAVLDQARIGAGTRHLDIGCGAGAALVLAPFVGADKAVRLRNMFRLVSGRRPA